jgi:uncharacterized protein
VFVLKLLATRSEGVGGGERARQFLYWLRRLRQEYPKVRWILAGSIGLDTVSSRLNMSDAINDLRIVSLGPFTVPVAHDFLQQLASSYRVRLDEHVRTRLFERIGWLAPHYLQLAFAELRQLTRHVECPTIADADCAIERLLSPQFKSHFDYWRQRLKHELDAADAAHAMALLNAVVMDPQGVPLTTLSGALAKMIPDADDRRDRLRYLLDVLINDGYLVEHEGRFRLQFVLLREYWRRRIAPIEAMEAVEAVEVE